MKKWDFGSSDFVSDEVRHHLIEEAKKYDSSDIELYKAEIGWEDWMEDFTDASDGECISEAECTLIEKVLDEAFDMAHSKTRYRK